MTYDPEQPNEIDDLIDAADAVRRELLLVTINGVKVEDHKSFGKLWNNLDKALQAVT